MPNITGITETALYVDDLERAAQFHIAVLGARVVHRDERLCALKLTEDQVLLLFRRGASVQSTDLGFGTVPAHDGAGPLHVCFGIRAADLAAWEKKLERHGIVIESRVTWPAGATSLYFRDPDGHAIELATPGLWA